MARIFLSHAGPDAHLAARVAGWLTNHDVFLDRDPRIGLAVGEDWSSRLHERLRRSDVLICLVTHAYLASTWCSAELGIAVSRGMLVLPVSVDGRHPLLPANIQYTSLAEAQGRLREALLRLDSAGGRGWPDGRNPYPGLRPFDSDFQSVFFGRTTETAELARRVRQHSDDILVVFGPSGCGKSSVVRAGLRPAIAVERDWWVLPAVLPGREPVDAIAREIAAESNRLGRRVSVNDVRTAGLGASASELLVVTPGARHLLVVLDQFEAVLTQADPAAREQLAKELAQPGPIRTVLTIRPEFVNQLLADAALSAVPIETFAVRPPRTDALPTIIGEPARLAGFTFETGLIDRMVADTGTGDGLPLLAYALSQLGKNARRGTTVSHARYEEIGGVHGALIREADAALAETGRTETDVLATLLQLVAMDATGRPTRKRVPRGGLVSFDIDAFIDRRLLTGDTVDDVPHVEVAHEAFLTTWPPLAGAVRANATALRAREAVEAAAAGWAGAGRPGKYLWDGGHLATKLDELGDLPRSPDADDFLQAAKRRSALRLNRLIAAAAAIMLVLAVGVATISQQLFAVRRQQAVTLSRQLIAQADAIRSTDPQTALRLNVAAERLSRDGNARAELVGAVAESVSTGADGRGVQRERAPRMRPLPYSPGLDSRLSSAELVALSPDDRTAAINVDRRLELWDVSDPAQPRILPTTFDPGGALSSLSFSSDSRTLFVEGRDRTLTLWKWGSRDAPRRLTVPIAEPPSGSGAVTVAPDGLTLATAADENSFQLWNIENIEDSGLPRPIGRPISVQEAARPYLLSFARNGRDPVVAVADGHLQVWGAGRQPERPIRCQLNRPVGHATAIAVAPRGDLVATAWANGELTLWQVNPDRRCRFVTTLPDNDTPDTHALAFNKDGEVLLGAGSDGTARAWDVTDPHSPARIGAPAVIPAGIRSLSVGSGTRLLITEPGRPGDRRQRLDLTMIQAIRRNPVALACAMAGGGLDETQWAGYLPDTEYRDTCSG